MADDQPSEELAQTGPTPAIHVNGETKEANFNDNYIAPEDEVADDGEHDEVSLGQEARVTMGAASTGKKKSRKRKPKSKRGLNAPTGFEEYYVDPPLTSVEAEEEQGLYHESLPFRERIEVAIQRYSAKRNLNSERKNVFDKWMAYGGVDTGPKMFSGGLDQNTLSDKTAAEIRTLTATHAVGQDKGDFGESEYAVDFEGVAKGFL